MTLASEEGLADGADDRRRAERLALLALGGGVLLIVAAELVLALVGIVPGVVCLGVAALVLLNAQALAPHSALPAPLALVPLLGLAGAAVPSHGLDGPARYALASIVALAGAWAAGRTVPVSWSALALLRVRRGKQLPIALAGIPLGALAYAVLRPAPLVAHAVSARFLLAAAALVLVALAEELVFRCVLQQAAEAALGGPRGRVLVNVLFGAAYIGALSPVYAVCAALVGLRFSAVVARTRSLWGVVAAHALLNIGLLLVWPLVWPS